jgi:hypothetical protein
MKSPGLSNDIKDKSYDKQSDTSTIITTDRFYKQSDIDRKKQNANFQKEKREGVYTQLKEVNKRLNDIENSINDKKTINIEFQGENMEWSISDIKLFIKEVGDIAETKIQKRIMELSLKEQHKFYKLDKYTQALEVLK